MFSGFLEAEHMARALTYVGFYPAIYCFISISAIVGADNAEIPVMTAGVCSPIPITLNIRFRITKRFLLTLSGIIVSVRVTVVILQACTRYRGFIMADRPL